MNKFLFRIVVICGFILTSSCSSQESQSNSNDKNDNETTKKIGYYLDIPEGYSNSLAVKKGSSNYIGVSDFNYDEHKALFFCDNGYIPLFTKKGAGYYGVKRKVCVNQAGCENITLTVRKPILGLDAEKEIKVTYTGYKDKAAIWQDNSDTASTLFTCVPNNQENFWE